MLRLSSAQAPREMFLFLFLLVDLATRCLAVPSRKLRTRSEMTDWVSRGWRKVVSANTSTSAVQALVKRFCIIQSIIQTIVKCVSEIRYPLR
jgi:hypothetical protein